MKKMMVGLLTAFILSVSISSNVFAGGGRRPVPVPEPMGYMLIATGGATLASVRYWMAKRRSKKDVEISRDVESE